MAVCHVCRRFINEVAKTSQFPRYGIVLFALGMRLYDINVLEIHPQVHLFQDQPEIVEDVDFLIHSRLVLFCHYFVKSVGHDSDKHVQECDLQSESRPNEDDPQNNLMLPCESVRVEFSKSEFVRVEY